MEAQEWPSAPSAMGDVIQTPEVAAPDTESASAVILDIPVSRTGDVDLHYL